MAKNSDTVAVIIHTFNEEKNIVACIESARLLTANIIVIDMNSEDNTVSLAKKLGSEVFEFPRSNYVEPARGFGIEKAKADWVLILDADERISQELASEIKDSIRSLGHASFKIPRKNIFGAKKWLKHGGWWPDMQIRLIKKSAFKNWPKRIHSTPQIDGTQTNLTNPIMHYFHGDLSSMVGKTIVFEDIESNLLYKAGRRSSTPTMVRKFLGELYRRLIRDRGFLDGKIGIIESIYQAFSKTITYLYLYEKRESGTL